YLDSQNYVSPTDALYVGGAQFSTFRGLHIYGASGNKQNAGIRLQQSSGNSNHNNEFNRFEDNVIGPWFTGGANGNDPDLCSTLNQCAQFRYGILFDQPNANNDQTIFSNNVIVGADVGFDQFANQSAEIVADRLVVD